MRTLIYSLTFVIAAGCAGNSPPPGDQPMPDAGNDIDSPIQTDEGQKVGGKAMDYFGAVALSASTVETDGVTPQMSATSLDDGSWLLESVPRGSKVYLSVSHANYRSTRNIATTVAEADVTQDVYVMSTPDVNRQYTSLGKTPLAGTAFLAAEMQKGNGMPLEGIPLASVKLVDANDQPVPGIIGPYFFGAAGDIDPALTTSAAFGGRARVAFLDVPAGSFSLKVVETAQLTHTAAVTASADGAVLALTGGMGTMTGGPLNPSFATDIYPRLQKAAQGGLGCANCHTNGGSGGVLRYDEPAANVLASIQARPGVIDLVTPDVSLLLTKPLYEPPPAPQNHPNATFLDINDPDYKLFLLWIQQGAMP